MSRLTDRELLELLVSQVQAQSATLDNLAKTQNESHLAHAVLAQEFRTACDVVKKHDVDINGNGKTGLKGDLIAINGRLDGIEDKVKAFGKAIWGAVGAGIIMVVNSFLDLIIY